VARRANAVGAHDLMPAPQARCFHARRGLVVSQNQTNNATASAEISMFALGRSSLKGKKIETTRECCFASRRNLLPECAR
jgi:hypothetical protein